MAVTPTSFQSAFPEFAGTSTVTIQAMLTRAELRVGGTAELDITEAQRDELVGLLAAHFASVSDRSGFSPGTTGIEEIDVHNVHRVRLGRGNGGAGLQATSYGQDYEALRNSLIVPIRII